MEGSSTREASKCCLKKCGVVFCMVRLVANFIVGWGTKHARLALRLSKIKSQFWKIEFPVVTRSAVGTRSGKVIFVVVLAIKTKIFFPFIAFVV